MYKRESRISTCIKSLEIRTPSQARSFHRKRERGIKAKHTKKAIPRNRCPKMEQWPNSVCTNRPISERKKKKKKTNSKLQLRPNSAKTNHNPFFEKGCAKDTIFAGPARENSPIAMLQQWKWSRKKRSLKVFMP